MYPMKNLYKGIACLVLFFAGIRTNAQSPPVKEPDMNRPLLFQQLPQRLNARINNLLPLLQYNTGTTVNVNAADGVNLSGIVTSVSSDNDNSIRSVVIRLSDFPGAALSFSKITLQNGEIKYAGRIISFQHGDAYEINLENGQYYFVKKGFYDLVND
jgi:hypothetical protein